VVAHLYVLRGNDYPVGGEALREDSWLGIQDTWTDQDIQFFQGPRESACLQGCSKAYDTRSTVVERSILNGSLNDTGSIDNGTKKKSYRPIWDLPLPKEDWETILSLFWTFPFPGCARDISPWEMTDRCSHVSN